MLIVLWDVCLALLAVILTYSFIRAVIKRADFLRRLSRVCTKQCHTVERPRNAAASFFRAAAVPDLIVHTADCDYRVRFITCILRKKFYHFVGPNAYASYFKLGIVLPMAREATTTMLLPRYHELPPLHDADQPRSKDILLFNPLPVEITAFDEKSGTQPVSNGTLLGKFTVYDGSHFLALLDK